MTVNSGIADDDYVPGSAGEPPRRLRYVVAATVILMLAAFIANRTEQPDSTAQAPASDRQMPVTNPPLEPTRPDLIGEPRIDDPQPRNR